NNRIALGETLVAHEGIEYRYARRRCETDRLGGGLRGNKTAEAVVQRAIGIEPDQDHVVAQGVTKIGVARTDDGSISLHRDAAATIAQRLGGMVGERLSAIEFRVDAAVFGKEAHHISVIVS